MYAIGRITFLSFGLVRSRPGSEPPGPVVQFSAVVLVRPTQAPSVLRGLRQRRRSPPFKTAF
jgi:hypothetical protein